MYCLLEKKPLLQLPVGLSQTLSIPSQAWQSISMDFITALPRSNYTSIIFVIIDLFGACQGSKTVYGQHHQIAWMANRYCFRQGLYFYEYNLDRADAVTWS